MYTELTHMVHSKFHSTYISQDHISTMELESTPSVSDSEGESP